MSEAELRAMVREVLREALAKGRPAKAPAPAPAARAEAVRIASDADLAGFVQRLVAMMDDPATAKALRAGARRFTLAGALADHAAAPAAGAVLSGTVTEAKVSQMKGAGTIVLAPDAVITPLARDRARALGLKIERRR
jgi:hypothetical protein